MEQNWSFGVGLISILVFMEPVCVLELVLLPDDKNSFLCKLINV